jgi:penicillin-binding protein 1C
MRIIRIMIKKTNQLPAAVCIKKAAGYFSQSKVVRYLYVLFILFIVFLTWLFWPVIYPFPERYSKLIYDTKGTLLHAFLAEDDQLRFPPDTIALSKKYVRAAVIYEDRRYYFHPGVDVLSLINAFISNLQAGKNIRGGSTIPMQIARLARPKNRSYINKIRECFTAIKLSVHYSKSELLRMYAAHVPMGANIVGIHAASYRYFGKPAGKLSWAEAALFAVLPNSPSLINLSKKRIQLIRKRNALLYKMYQMGSLDSLTCALACSEPLPEHNRNLPFSAPHFCHFVDARQHAMIIRTTLDLEIQKRVVDVIENYKPLLTQLSIPNLAVLVTETGSGNVRAYVGSQDYSDTLNAGRVDGIQSYRSTGSLLKPFLVAKSLDRGPFTLASLIRDVPTFYGTFCPQNASKEFQGLVTIEDLLIQSLNVPAVRLLNRYGVRDFYGFLQKGGLDGLFRSAAGYGLTLILGGAEASLWELSHLYLHLANYGTYKPMIYIEANEPIIRGDQNKKLFSEGSAWLVLTALNKLSRPGVAYYWYNFNDQIPVAWKTGTSYGQRDGWAIGVNRQWTVAVWAGNFSGEGNASLGGAKSAAPLLFDIFNAISDYSKPLWFEEPEYDLTEVACCKTSGYPAGPHCPEQIMIKRPLVQFNTGTCTYHKRYLVDKNSGKSVCSLCWTGIDTTWVTRFVVSASTRDILIKAGKTADVIPVHAGNCPGFIDEGRLELVYPLDGIKILVPRDYNSAYEKVVFSATHQHTGMRLFWYLNGSFIGETEKNHQLAVALEPGKYNLNVQDEEGYSRMVSFLAYRN